VNKSNTTIKTNIILTTQLKVEKLVEDYVRTLRLQNIRNAAVMVMDNKTHKVISYIGSGSFKDTTDGGQVNGANAIRQPGSTLKPLLYGLCIDEGFATPKSILNDVPVNYAGYAPENYDQKFNGFVTMEYALEHSLNIPAVKSIKQLGKDRLTGKLIELNFKQVKKDQRKLGLSMILGGCGTTLEELTALFSSFANGGKFVQPLFLQDETVGKAVTVLSPASNYMVTDILSKVNRPDFPLNWQATEHMPKIAWKTGTSYGRKDAWSIGYNRQYTVGVWVGNFSGQGVAELSGANTATPLLFKIFNSIDYGNNGEWFTKPEACDLRQVCSETGLPPGPNCTNLIADYFIPLVSTTTVCQHLQEVKVSADETVSYCTNCAPATGYKKKMYRILVPEMQAYFTDTRSKVKQVPPHNPDCETVFKGNGPDIISPLNGNEYYINKKNPEPLELRANTNGDVSKLYWYVNDQFYKTAGVKEKQFFIPSEGPVKISCTDDKGRNRNIWIRVKYVDL
jgi:penicillin-binding protein 1C